jgi:hypothetical protein
MFGVHIAVERRAAARRSRPAGRRAVASVLVAGLLALAPATTVLANDGTSVPVTVTASGAACITLSGTPSWAFGTQHFSTPNNPVYVPGTDPAIVVDCSGFDQTLEASIAGLNSSGPSKASWSPIDGSIGQSGPNPCDTGLNQFIFKVGRGSLTQLTQTLAQIDTMPAGSPGLHEASQLSMPCTGSGGTGELMSGTVTIVALLVP